MSELPSSLRRRRHTTTDEDDQTPLLPRAYTARTSTSTHATRHSSAWSTLGTAARNVSSAVSKAATTAMQTLSRTPPTDTEIWRAITSWAKHDEVHNQLTNLALNDLESEWPWTYKGFDPSVSWRMRNSRHMPREMLRTEVPFEQHSSVGYTHVLKYLDKQNGLTPNDPLSLASRHSELKKIDRGHTNSRLVCGQADRKNWLPRADWHHVRKVIDDAAEACRRLPTDVEALDSGAV